MMALGCMTSIGKANQLVLVEPESFDETGGWVVDQQFMDLMGSPYLLAHGLGEPVPTPRAGQLPAPGISRVGANPRLGGAVERPGGAGQVSTAGEWQAARNVFGTEGAEWHWQDGGIVKVGSEARSPCTT